MSLYIYNVGANVETVASLDHKAAGPRVRILLQNQHQSTGVILKTSGLFLAFAKHDFFFSFGLHFFGS